MPDPSVKPCIIFDFDGTLVLSEQIHAQAWRQLALMHEKNLPTGFIESGVGRTDRSMSGEVAAFWDDGIDAEQVLAYKQKIFRELALREMRMVPGAIDAVKHFAIHHKLALATSASRSDVEPILHREGISSLFAHILTIEDITRPKPDPQIFNVCMHLLGCPAGACWIFEDSRPGLQAALSSGANVIALTTLHKPEELPATAGYFPDFTALDEIDALISCQSGV